MFDTLPGTAALQGDAWGEGFDRLSDHLSDAELAGFWGDLEPEPMFDVPDGPDMSAPGCSVADCEPSGWLALELDTGTADPTRLSDEHLIDAIIGFDRLTSWSAARQARLLAELTRRRPPDPVPNADRASVASRSPPTRSASRCTWTAAPPPPA